MHAELETSNLKLLSDEKSLFFNKNKGFMQSAGSNRNR
jgi:hypothetical protein